MLYLQKKKQKNLIYIPPSQWQVLDLSLLFKQSLRQHGQRV